MILVFVVLGVLGGAYYYQKQSVKIKPMKTFRWLGAFWFNEQGMFKFEETHLKFYNPKTGNKVIACSRAGCEHTTKDCPATYMSLGITYTDEGMIFFGEPKNMEFDEKGLYIINVEGKHLKQLHLFKGVSEISDVFYEGSKVYISYRNSIDKEGNDLDQPEVGIIEYDIDTNKERKLFQEKKGNPQIMTMNRNKSGLFFVYLYSTMSAEEALEHAEDNEYAKKHQHIELRYIGLNGKKASCVCDNMYSFNCIPVLNQKAVVCKEDGVYLCTEGGKTEKILSGKWESIPFYRNGKEGLLLRTHEKRSKDEKVEYAYYKTEKSSKKTLYSKHVCLSVVGENAWFMDEEGMMYYGSASEFVNGKEIEEKNFKEKR